MIRWIKVFILGVIIWFLLTLLYGFTIAILDLNTAGSFENNFILLPVGIWLGYKIIKYREDKLFKDYANISQEGVDEEIDKAKDNKSTNPVENQLVPDQHLGILSWTVASWRLTIENSTNKMMLEKKAVKFCRLFLAQEKKREKIKDYNRADVRILYTLSLSCPLNEVDKLIAKNGWTLEVGHQFEKEIGYK
tara:strand:+ start:1089 stop:1664 length:576 start_codon:yes stop_codon:yes gene_type:complete